MKYVVLNLNPSIVKISESFDPSKTVDIIALIKLQLQNSNLWSNFNQFLVKNKFKIEEE